jgi:hypothetical protein
MKTLVVPRILAVVEDTVAEELVDSLDSQELGVGNSVEEEASNQDEVRMEVAIGREEAGTVEVMI